jgi:hypothetical protein
VDYAQHELESDFRALGFGACRACMTNPCKWKPLLDLKEYTARRQELSDELHFVKMNPEQESFDTIVPISVREFCFLLLFLPNTFDACLLRYKTQVRRA